jgi:serine/threonine-protein kinase
MVLGGRYRLERALGAGGMAEVFEGTDLSTGHRLAVKVLRPHLAESAEAVLRFRREGQVLAALKNPAVVAIEAVQELTDGRIFIVMELLEGETLGTRMKRGALTTNQLAPIVAGCAAGLAAAHAHGVVHRDLKPDNIFLARLPNGDDQLKLLDFGVSKVRGEEKLTQTGQVLGTPRYMSPEQLGAEPDIDGRVDVYALGVILYEALSGGKSPFLASTPTDLIVAILNGKVVPLRSVQPNVPPALEAVVLRAMAKVRSARYASATELAEAFFDAGDIQAKPAPKQLGTSALGSMRTVAFGGELLVAPSEPTQSQREYAQGPGGLAQGTFSELPAFDVRPVQRGTLEPQESSPAGPMVARMSLPDAGPASPRAIPPTSLSPAIVLPEPTVGPTEPTAHPLASTRPQLGGRADQERRHPAVRHDPSGRVSQLPPEPLPMSRIPSGLVLIVAGLLAGGLAAGAVIATLTWLQQASGSMPEVPPPPPPMLIIPPDAGPDAPSLAAATGAIVGEATERGRTTTGATAGGSAASRAGEAATAEASPTPSTTTPTPTPATATTPATVPPATVPPATVPPATVPPAAATPAAATEVPRGRDPAPRPPPSETGGSEGVDPVIAASRALARGDARECVDILDDVIASGGTPLALRRRADCLARLGEMGPAIRDYQRFCRVVPDHPAITEVREILEGLGQSCP